MAAVGFEQAPVEVLHVPAVWHWSDAVHTTGLLPVQVPLWQVSVCVQALPSLQVVPFATVGFEQTPVEVLQVPAVWHWSNAAHTTGVPALQAPALHVSAPLHGLPSLQDVPLATFVCVTTPAELHESAVHGLPSSMEAVTEPLHEPLEQVPVVVPMPFVQDAVPQARVLFVCVTCPVVALHVSVVHGLPSSIVVAAPAWQLPAVLQKLAPIPWVAVHDAGVLQAVLQQTWPPAAVGAQKPDAQSVPRPQAWPAANLSPHLFVSVLHVTLLQSVAAAQVVLQVVELQP